MTALQKGSPTRDQKRLLRKIVRYDVEGWLKDDRLIQIPSVSKGFMGFISTTQDELHFNMDDFIGLCQTDPPLMVLDGGRFYITKAGYDFVYNDPEFPPSYKQKQDLSATLIKLELGNGNTFYGDIVVARAIENSFNKTAAANIPDEVKDLLNDLSIAVGKMSEVLPQEEGRRVARSLETLTDEATSENPERRWWEVSVEGLKKAAKDIGEIGKPVLDIVARLVPILLQKSG